MRFFISGGSGFVGSYLTDFLLDRGHQVIATGTRPDTPRAGVDGYQYIQADTTRPGRWQAALADVDVVVNLAGKTIFKRWTRRYKQQMYDSRVLTTRNIVDALAGNNDAVLLSTSAVGYYGDCGDNIVTEATPPANDFLGRLSIDWEEAAVGAAKKGSRVAVCRFGVVMGPGGGALKQMLPAFRMFAGGPLGTGRQWFPWVHIHDVAAAMAFLADRRDLSGAFNFTAPEPLRYADAAKAIGRRLHRPARLKTPGMMLRLTLGEVAGTLLASQRVVPQRLVDTGYSFQFMRFNAALENLL